MTGNRSRRAVLRSGIGIAALLGGCIARPNDAGGNSGSGRTRTTTSTPSPSETPVDDQFATAGPRPAVVDLSLSRRLDDYLSGSATIDGYDSLAADFRRVVVDGEFYALASAPSTTEPGEFARCAAVPSRQITVRAAAVSRDVPDTRAFEDLPEAARVAVSEAAESGSYSASRLQANVEASQTDPMPDSLPPVSYVRREGTTYFVATFSTTSPECAIGPAPELDLRPAGRATPALYAVDASDSGSRTAIEVAAGGETYVGDGAVLPAIVSIARKFDYAALPGRPDGGVTYYRPSLSGNGDAYRFELAPVVSGPLGP